MVLAKSVPYSRCANEVRKDSEAQRRRSASLIQCDRDSLPRYFRESSRSSGLFAIEISVQANVLKYNLPAGAPFPRYSKLLDDTPGYLYLHSFSSGAKIAWLSRGSCHMRVPPPWMDFGASGCRIRGVYVRSEHHSANQGLLSDVAVLWCIVLIPLQRCTRRSQYETFKKRCVQSTFNRAYTLRCCLRVSSNSWQANEHPALLEISFAMGSELSIIYEM